MSNVWKNLIFKASGYKPKSQSLVSFETKGEKKKFHEWSEQNKIVYLITCEAGVSADYITDAIGKSNVETIVVLYDTKGVNKTNFRQYGDKLKSFIILKILQDKGQKYVYVDVVCGAGGGWFMFYSALELASEQNINQVRLESVSKQMIKYHQRYGFSVTPRSRSIHTATDLTKQLKIMANQHKRSPMNLNRYVKFLGSVGAGTHGNLLKMQINTSILGNKLNAIAKRKMKQSNYTLNTLVNASQSRLSRGRTEQVKKLIAKKEGKLKVTKQIQKSIWLLSQADGRAANGNSIIQKINSLKTPSLKKTLRKSLTMAQYKNRSIRRSKAS